MLNLTIVVCGVWLLVTLCKLCWPKPRRRPTILTHRLSERDSLVYVERDGQFWVGLYSEGTQPTEEEQPDWYKSIIDRRN